MMKLFRNLIVVTLLGLLLTVSSPAQQDKDKRRDQSQKETDRVKEQDKNKDKGHDRDHGRDNKGRDDKKKP